MSRSSAPAEYHIPARSPQRVNDVIRKIAGLLRRNIMAATAATLALVTSFIVPPDREYLDYFDFRTLACLFCTLAVVCALKNIKFFTLLARRIVALTGNFRTAVLALIYITFIGSMFLANDMALLTFLPLGYILLEETGNQRQMAFTFIMQNIAANLGGMLTPFGNPQNLYLYSKFNIPTGEFMAVMAIPFAAAVLLMTFICFILRAEPIRLTNTERLVLPPLRTTLYLALFIFSILIVFRFIPYWIGLLLIPAVLLFSDRKTLGMVDYPLLFTFFCFFIFSGNMSRIEAVNRFVSRLIEKNTLLVSTLSCQVISNVPSAILLSRFTENWPELLVGVNIGGTGTLIASLASLITFREFGRHNKGFTRKYLVLFTALNFVFLIILYLISMLYLQIFPIF